MLKDENTKTDQINNINYLDEFRFLRQEILNGDKTWQDAIELREKYNQPQISKETLRKGAFIFDEYNQAGWVKKPENANNKGRVLITDGTSYKNYDYTDSMDSISYTNNTYSKTETVELKPDGNIGSDRIVDILPSDITNPETLLKAHGFNPDKFELVSAKNSKWQQGITDGTKNLYSSKIVVKPIQKLVDANEVVDYFKDFKPNYTPEKVHIDASRYGDSALILPLYDIHFGRRARMEEVNEEYNLEIAKKDIYNSVKKFWTKVKDSNKFGKVVLVIGQDFLNSSSTGSTSSGKHVQENASSFRDIFIKGSELLIEIIDMFRADNDVLVWGIEGNHAREEEVMLFQFLRAWYRNDEHVTVDAEPNPRKYIKWGCNLIGSTHGSDEKDRIFGIMQQEVPELWGQTNYRCFITGHLHHFKVEEKNGVDVFVVPAMCKKDMWTHKSGYMSKRRTVAFVFDSTEGLSQQYYINLE